jgi:hypothetical protein
MVVWAAITLPIILAVMGVVVSIEPIPHDGPWKWAWIAAFIVVGIFTVVFSGRDRRNSDRAQEDLRQQISGLKDAIDNLTKPVPREKAEPERDPDALYQNGNVVGTVTGARLTLNQSKVYFAHIKNAGHLDRNRPFEYRQYLLKFVRADSYTGMLISTDGSATNVFGNVVCDIVGSR